MKKIVDIKKENNLDVKIIFFLGIVTVIVIFIIGLISIIKSGVEKSEQVECIKWKKQSEIYQEYYLKEWQNEQCLSYNIKIYTPIK